MSEEEGDVIRELMRPMLSVAGGKEELEHVKFKHMIAGYSAWNTDKSSTPHIMGLDKETRSGGNLVTG